MNDNSFSDDKAFQEKLEQTLRGINASRDLQQRLMQIPEASTRQLARGGQALWRALPVAAVLLLALGLGIFFQPEADPALAREIFAHIYLEEPYFGDGKVLRGDEVEARMAPVMGDHMPATGATQALAVTFAKDCLIAKQRGMHLVVDGETGPVNLMMLPDQLVDRETTISDERFAGIITPASGGTLVVVGNKREPIARLRDQVARNLNWQY